jgi:hypothetical protein
VVLSLPKNTTQRLKRMISPKTAATKTAPMKIHAERGLRGGHSKISHI